MATEEQHILLCNEPWSEPPDTSDSLDAVPIEVLKLIKPEDGFEFWSELFDTSGSFVAVPTEAFVKPEDGFEVWPKTRLKEDND